MLIIKKLVTPLLLLFLAFGQCVAQLIVYPVQNPQAKSAIIQSNDSLPTEHFDAVGGRWSYLNIIADPQIETLLDIRREESERLGGMRGYRIKIYNGDKQNAMDSKSLFISKYPGIRVYVEFQTPDFVTLVGDFRNKSEALKVQKKISVNFKSTYIIDDIINFPELNARDD